MSKRNSRQRKAAPPASGGEVPFIMAAAGVFLVIAWPMVIFGHWQFGGNDLGVMIDVAYRLYHGQHPYADFPITQPILFYLGSLWAIQIFGVNYSSFVYMNVLFGALTFALQVTMLRRLDIAKGWALAIAAGIEVGALIPNSYWWYNPCTSLAVTLLSTAGVLVLRKPSNRLNWIFYCICLFLASLAKPNMAGITILACSLAILIRKETRVKGLLYSLGTACCSLALLAIYRLNPITVVHSYFAAAGRGAPNLEIFVANQKPIMVFWQSATLAAVLLPLIALVARRIITRNPWRVDLCCSIVLFGGILAALAGSFTNGEMKVTDTCDGLACVGLFCLFSIDEKKDRTIRWPLFLQQFSIAFVVLLSFWMGYTRYRVELIGPFWQPGPQFPVGDHNAFFSRLRCGPAMLAILDDTTRFVEAARKVLKREPRLFFGPRMTWGYAAFNTLPPLGIPYSWWSGVDYATDQLPTIEENFKKNNFDYCVFFSYSDGSVDTIYIPNEMLGIIAHNYKVCFRTQCIVILAKNGPGN